MNQNPAATGRVFPAILVVGLLALTSGVLVNFVNRSHFGPHRKTTSLATANAIEGAINAFYTDVGTMPDVGKSSVRLDSPEGVKLLTILLGLHENVTSPQSIATKYLSVKEAKLGKSGIVYNSNTHLPEGVFDLWGNPFTVELDTQYQNRIQFTVGSKTVQLEGRRSAVYSPGADGKMGTMDDVTTW